MSHEEMLYQEVRADPELRELFDDIETGTLLEILENIQLVIPAEF